MPAAYHISDDEALMTVRVDQEVDLLDLFELASALIEDPVYGAQIPLLVDLRGMKVTADSTSQRSFHEFIIQNFAHTRTASTATLVNDSLNGATFAAVYELSCAVQGCELFEDYDHAMKWLIRMEFASTGKSD